MNTSTDDLARSFVRALTGNDGAALMALLSEDIEYWLPGDTPISGRTQGKEALLRLFARILPLFGTPNSIRTNNIIVADEWVVIECEGAATTRLGASYTNTYCLVLRCHDGKIVKWTEYADTEKIRILCNSS
jgi:ketosteroid isomerase-like protein